MSFYYPELYEQKALMLKTTCWFCNTEITMIAKEGHDCPVYKRLSKGEAAIAGACLSALDFCDHYCCNMPANVCRAVHLIAELKREELLK
jgi:hypothetical protein